MTTKFDPYHQVGLRRNPFIVPQDLWISPDRWSDFGYSMAVRPGQRLFVQFLGEKGAGKTSHLLHWQAQTGGPYFYQAAWQWQYFPPCHRDEKGTAIAYWDEANRIPFPTLIWALKRAYNHHLTLVIGSHRNLAGLAHWVGYRTQTINLNNLTLLKLKAWIDQQFQAEFLPERSPEQIFGFEQIKAELTDQFLLIILQQSAGSWRKVATILHRWLAQKVKLFLIKA